MQQTTTTTSNILSPVHIKVAHENEYRRFLLNPVSFEKLESTLKSLFNLQTRDFQIRFQDDENDWVLLTTDHELVYATELSGSPLRLQLKLLGASTQEKPTCEGFKGRGGCRAGVRGEKMGRGGWKSLSDEERLAKSSSRLSERITELETKLDSKKLTSEREQMVRWRLNMLKEKLATVKAMQESLAIAANVEQQSVATGEQKTAETPKTEPVPGNEEKLEGPCGPWGKGRRGGRGGRGGCGGWRRAMGEEGECKKGRAGGFKKLRVDPELVAKFRQCKADLHAARESGDAEKISACLEAFKAAKSAKWEARAALRAQAQACNDEEKA